jgi:hypothetical protein
MMLLIPEFTTEITNAMIVDWSEILLAVRNTKHTNHHAVEIGCRPIHLGMFILSIPICIRIFLNLPISCD